MTRSEWLYNLLIHAGLPVGIVGHYLGLMGRSPDSHTSARIQPPDFTRLPSEVRFWIHGASVGEMGLVNRVLRMLINAGVPGEQIVVSAQTLSGLNTLNRCPRFLLPFDYPQLLRPLVEYLDPDQLLILETEIWPNLYRLNHNRVTLLNARMNRKSFEWYRRFQSLFRSTLSHCRGIAARADEDARRFRVMAPRSLPIRTTGSLKWTQFLDEPSSLPDESPRFEDNVPVLVAGSTHPGEEEVVLDWIKQFEFNVYLAPRHLERLEDVKALLEGSGISWIAWSRADGMVSERVVLVDEFGLLSGLYGRADLVFVGGTLAPVGGHNLIEPARYGIPILVGPHLETVRETADRLESLQLLHRIQEPEQAESILRELERSGYPGASDALDTLRNQAERIKDRYDAEIRSLVAG